MTRSPALKKMRRSNCKQIVKEIGLSFIKDALITQLQPMYSKQDILDLDVGDLQDPVSVVIYTRKEVQRKK
jgi:hypothetical protein